MSPQGAALSQSFHLHVTNTTASGSLSMVAEMHSVSLAYCLAHPCTHPATHTNAHIHNITTPPPPFGLTWHYVQHRLQKVTWFRFVIWSAVLPEEKSPRSAALTLEPRPGVQGGRVAAGRYASWHDTQLRREARRRAADHGLHHSWRGTHDVVETLLLLSLPSLACCTYLTLTAW